MDQLGLSVSSFDCDVLRSAFIKSVIEDNIPQERWRTQARLLISDYTGRDDIEPELLEWIVRKVGSKSAVIQLIGADYQTERMSFFDLDILREAFRQSVGKHHISEADWAEHAKLFLEQLVDEEEGREIAS